MEWKIRILIWCVMGLVTFLPILIAMKYNRKHQERNWCEDGYVMRQSKGVFVICIFITAGHFLFVAISVILLDESIMAALICMLLFSVGLIAGIFLSTYALLWRCVVKADTMTFNCSFLPAKEIKIYEITTVKYVENRVTAYGEKKALVAYCNKKKMFEIFDDVIGFQLLYYHFYQLGKIMRGELKEEFSVKTNKEDIFVTLFALVFFGGIVIGVLIFEKESLSSVYIVAIMCMALFFLFDLIYKLLWKVTINFDTIQIRDSFGKSETYSIQDITKFQEKGSYIFLYTGTIQIAKISKNSENFQLLQERLRYEGICKING